MKNIDIGETSTSVIFLGKQTGGVAELLLSETLVTEGTGFIPACCLLRASWSYPLSGGHCLTLKDFTGRQFLSC